MIGLFLVSRDISEYIADLVDIENGTTRWLIRMVAGVTPLFVFARFTKLPSTTGQGADEGS
jgi:hypothetical protein